MCVVPGLEVGAEAAPAIAESSEPDGMQVRSDDDDRNSLKERAMWDRTGALSKI